MKWITREHIHVDRIACPWLIRKFIDRDAQFIFAPADKVMEMARQEGAIAFDVKGQAELDHHDGKCSFEMIMEKYRLSDAGLLEMAKIVHSADITADRSARPEAAGLEAIGRGFGLVYKNDHEILDKELPVYDALYAYCNWLLNQKHP